METKQSQTSPAARENIMGTMEINPLLVKLSVPMMISMLVQALYNVVDSVFVSHVSESALTAVSLAFSLQNVMIAVGAILFVSLTIYRIDWARHPEKYKDLVEDEDPQKAEYRKKKEADKKAAAQKAKEKEKQLKRQKRVDKLNHYRAINGKGPVGMDGKPIDKKKK
mgnify:CR=1 FL=1